jgi:hypothetical protein
MPSPICRLSIKVKSPDLVNMFFIPGRVYSRVGQQVDRRRGVAPDRRIGVSWMRFAPVNKMLRAHLASFIDASLLPLLEMGGR